MGRKGSRKKKASLYKQKGKQSHERNNSCRGVLEPILHRLLWMLPQHSEMQY
jgi:hypothetical protein